MTPGELAAAAAESVRQLNHATSNRQGFDEPAQAWQVFAELAAVAQRLPQAIEQAMAWLAREQAAGRLRDDRGYAMSLQWFEILEGADAAGARALVLGHALTALAEETSHLGSATDESPARTS